MPATRMFLGWEEPAVTAAARILSEPARSEGMIDLGKTTVVVPGSRAGRSLLEALVTHATSHACSIIPPQIVTISAFPEQLYTPRQPFASPVTQQAVWSQSLQSQPRLREFLPHAPRRDDALGWAELGQQLAGQFQELCAELLSFDHVRKQAVQGRIPDAERWEFLAATERTYLDGLAGMGLTDCDHARSQAVSDHRCRSDRRVVLLAMTDLSAMVRAMLDQIDGQVTVLIHAPESYAESFDGYGCIQVDWWNGQSVRIAEGAIRVVAGPREQAHAVVSTLADWSQSLSVDQIRIAVPDVQLVPELQMRLLQADVPSRWLYTKPFVDTGPSRLLNLAARYLVEPTFGDFAALLRHPDLRPWLYAHNVPLSITEDADSYFSDHLPPRIGVWLGSDKATRSLRQVYSHWETALSPLRLPDAKLSRWPERLFAFLTTMYGPCELELAHHDGHELGEALGLVRDKLVELQQTPDRAARPVSAEQAIRILQLQLAHTQLPSPPHSDALELLGWLELPLDPAPAVIVTTVNEGFVPITTHGDPLLPETLRKRLNLPDSDRRLARDAYVLEVLLNTRSHVQLVAAKRDTKGNPLIPSRLLLRDNDDAITSRCLRWFDELPSEPSLQPQLAADVPPVDNSPLLVPLPVRSSEPLLAMSVTSFRDYLNCPYRFYLRHVQHLNTLHDEDDELSPRVFGNLLHDTLEQFGKSDVTTSPMASRVCEFLLDTLQSLAYRQFGEDRRAAVQIQLESARHRLTRFAEWQAKRAIAGWQIEHTELAFNDDEVTLPLRDGHRMGVKGRIDRVDWHPDMDQWEVLDYKTSDSGKQPQMTHRRRDEWVDLQLPLYHYMVPFRDIPTQRLRLGYILLPKNLQRVGPAMADWTEAEIRDAQRTATHVAQQVHEQVFWPPADGPLMSPPELEPIVDQRRISAEERHDVHVPS